MKPWSRLDWLIILLFAMLVALFFWRIWTPNLADRQSFPPGDFHAQFWAFTTFEVRELSAGRLPLWNPYTFAGAPFWADVQSAVFYPPSLLTLLLSAPWGFSLFALEVEAIAHFWLAAVFMYLFSRQLTHSRAAAVIAALTFTFSGYLAGYPSQQLAVLEADVWLPLILFFLYRAHERPATEDRRPATNDQSQPTTNDRLADHTSRFTLHASEPKTPFGRFTFQSQRPPRAEGPLWVGVSRFTLHLLLAGVAWGMTLLAGHPQSALIVAYLSCSYLVFLRLTTGDRRPTTGDQRSETEDQRRATIEQFITHHASRIRAEGPLWAFHVLRFTPPLLLFLLTGLALAAVQFLPAAEYTIFSVRAEGSYDKMSGGFPLTDAIQLLLPGQVSLYSPLYVGLVGLILAVTAAFIPPARQRQTIFWGLVAAVTLLISFGGNTFFYSPLYLTTPGFAIFRGQERWAFAVAFSLSVLTGYGFKQMIDEWRPATGDGQPARSPSRFRAKGPLEPKAPYGWAFYVLRFTFYVFLFSLLLTFLFFYGLNDTGWRPESPFYDLLGGATLLTILSALAWLLWRFAARLPVALFTACTAALICFDLFTANWQTNLYPQLPEWHTQMPAVVAAIKEDAAKTPDEPYRVYNEFRLYDNYGVPFEIEDLWGASPLRPARYDEFLAPPMPIERTWELLNVKYVITWRQELYLPSTIIYEEPAGSDTTYVHRLTTVGPRAWLVTQAEIAGDATILQKIADPTFDRWHVALLEPGAEPFIEEIEETATADRRPPTADHRSTTDPLRLTPESQRLPRAEGPPEPKAPYGWVDTSHITHHASRITFHSPQSFSLQVTTSVPVLLILSETYYPGWQATVDDQPAPLLRANYVLRATPLPAGEHTVELTFWPLSFTLGAIISGLTVITLITILTLSAWPWRRRG